MPLLGLFSKKSKSPIKASADTPSISNVSLNDNEWVSVTTAVASTSGQRMRPQPRPQQQQQQLSSSSIPARMSHDDTVYDPPLRHSSLFPLQSDKDSLFRSTQSLPGHDDPDTRNSKARKLSSSSPPPPLPPKKSLFNWVSSKDRAHSSLKSTSPTDSNETSFNLKSFRHVRPESPSITSINLPSSTTLLPRPPSPKTPTLVPVPTSSLPAAPVSFQVTSRRPRPQPSTLSSDTSPTSTIFPSSQSQSSQVTPQSRVSAGVFRQAARRSATSLVLNDSNLSTSIASGAIDSSLGAGLSLSFEDDFNKATSALSSSPPKLSLFSFPNSTSNINSDSRTDVNSIRNDTSPPRPPRPQPPPSNRTAHKPSSSLASYTHSNNSSASVPSSSLPANSSLSPTSTTPTLTSTKPASSSALSRPVQTGQRHFFGSDSEDSESESEESESESDDSATGPPRVSRKRTVRPRNNATSTETPDISSSAPASGRPRAATTTSAPLRPSAVDLGTSSPKVDLLSSIPSSSPTTTAQSRLTENGNPSLERFTVPSSTSIDANANPGGARSRASASVGALHPSAKEARASVILANQRLSNATSLSTPKAMNKVLARNPGSDTSESSQSDGGSDRDSDEPLSTLMPPRRPGTSMSSYSTSSNSSLKKKPLIDISAPSTFRRPIGAPAPISREEEDMPKPRILVNATGRSSPNLKNPSPTVKVVPPSQSQQPPSQRQQQQQQQPGGLSSKTPLSFSSGSPMSSPSSSGASLATSSRGVGGASSDTSISPIDYHSKYHSFANGGVGLIGGAVGAKSGAAGTSPSRLSPANNSTTVLPPARPFLRRESPTTSSTGDSSSGKVPLTPKDGSDIRQNARPPSALLISGKDRKEHSRPTHGRKPSVTFEDELSPADKELRSGGNSGQHFKAKEDDADAKRRERRRTEAKAALELGRVVNGPPPVDDEDIGLDAGSQIGWPQFGMQMPMQVPMTMPMQPMYNMGGGMTGMGMPPQLQMPFPSPMPNGDPALLAAHQQAMAVAKHAFQCAVAQQALQAANDEWERNSTMSGFMPPSGAGRGSAYMNMNMDMRGSMMFPPAPTSMYAGNMGGGSLINGFGGGGGGGGMMGGPAGAWSGARSVYGGSFGPSTPTAMRVSTYSSTDLTAFNPALAGPGGLGGSVQGGMGQQQVRPGVRQRTKTAPSSQTSPVSSPYGSNGGVPPMPSPTKSAIRTRAIAPPSSFRGVPGQ